MENGEWKMSDDKHSRFSIPHSPLIPTGYKQTEVGVIPEDWDVVPIGKAGQVLGGRQRSPHYVGELCKYLRVANVFDGFIDTADVLEMPFSSAEKERFLLKDGDILLNEGQSIELVGRSAIYRGTPEDCCFQNTLVRFRAGPSVCPEFAQLVFQQFLRTGVFASIALQTTSIAHLGAGRFAALKMPRPTKVEQEAITEALNDTDAFIESLEQLIAKKRQIKQGAMQALLRPKNEWVEKRLGNTAVLKARIGWQGLTTAEYLDSIGIPICGLA
jgi:type I restriction enzyme, S subunit